MCQDQQLAIPGLSPAVSSAMPPAYHPAAPHPFNQGSVTKPAAVLQLPTQPICTQGSTPVPAPSQPGSSLPILTPICVSFLANHFMMAPSLLVSCLSGPYMTQVYKVGRYLGLSSFKKLEKVPANFCQGLLCLGKQTGISVCSKWARGADWDRQPGRSRAGPDTRWRKGGGGWRQSPRNLQRQAAFCGGHAAGSGAELPQRSRPLSGSPGPPYRPGDPCLSFTCHNRKPVGRRVQLHKATRLPPKQCKAFTWPLKVHTLA